MTKDGRPSLITDIRLFHGEAHTYLEGHKEAVAFGRRMAWCLNGEGLSLGAYSALYLYFTPSIPPGTFQVTDTGAEWWQRYTHVGVSPAFPDVAEADELLLSGIVGALLAIRPDQSELIRKAERLVRTHGAEMRFLLKRHETKRSAIEIAVSIAAWRQPSQLYVSCTDKVSGAYSEASPIALNFYDDGFHLAGSISSTETAIIIKPKQSFSGQLASAQYGGPLSIEIGSLVHGQRPVMSKIVRRQG